MLHKQTSHFLFLFLPQTHKFWFLPLLKTNSSTLIESSCFPFEGVMAQRAHVPKFGDWGSEQPYTVFFDTARKGRGGKMINPNDPQENPDMFPPNMTSQDPPPRPGPEPEEPPTYNKQQQQPSTRPQNDDIKQFAEYNDDKMNRRTNPGRVNGNRRSSGSDLSFELQYSSPHHPSYQAKPQRKEGTSPAREGRSSNNGNPGRDRSGKGNNVPDKGTAIPKFGAWNDEDPGSADNFTYIFAKAKGERHSVPENSASNAPDFSNTRNQAAAHEDDHAMICCFPWGRRK